MNADQPKAKESRILARRAVNTFAAIVVFVSVMLFVGVGLVASLAQRGNAGQWTMWANVGESFGALNSVLSGMALAAMVITFWVQHRELQTQRAELALQRASVAHAQTDLHRTAEANLRMLHVDLIRMAMDDVNLAAVWPSEKTGLSEERYRQYLYANLIIQQQRLQLSLGDYTEAQVQRALRYLFKSPLIREYWQSRAHERQGLLVPGTAEYDFDQMADGICTEYEIVLACATFNQADEGAVAPPPSRPVAVA